MSKAFFRFLRGELNGFYIQSINSAMNLLCGEARQTMFNLAQIQLEQDKIDSKTLYNLGKFAGIYLPRIPREESRSAVRMTESEYDEQLQYEFSERGLFKTEDEDFEFVQKVIDDTGLPDINTLATDTKRSSLVGDEETLGYIAEDEQDVVDDNGNVRPAKILHEPPEDKAYSDFHGNQFLFLAEGDTTYESVAPAVFLPLFKAIQYTRYNGATLTSLVKIVETLCPEGLVTISSIAVGDNKVSIIVYYSTDLSVDIDYKQDRINMLLYVVHMKFPQIVMTEAL